MATGPSIPPVVSAASGGSCHAPPQHLWVKLGRTAGMTLGACELARWLGSPRSSRCISVCTAAAPLPQPRHYPGPRRPLPAPGRPLAGSQRGLEQFFPPITPHPPSAQRMEHPGTEVMPPWSQGA